MMIKEWYSDNRPASVYMTIKCNSRKRFYICAWDAGRKNSNYAKREAIVDGSRTVYLSFPITPKTMHIAVMNMADRNDNDFTVEFEEAPLKTYLIALDAETREFLALNFYFSQISGFTEASTQGTPFTSSSGTFNIRYYPAIKDAMTGRVLNTPARIGHKTGLIEVAKYRFDRYTFAERVVILLHEYSHKYRNPKLGFAIGNEIGADINALYIYLGLGFSKIDAINVFANVFLKAQTDSNIKRMRAIMDYIQKFENEQFAQIA